MVRTMASTADSTKLPPGNKTGGLSAAAAALPDDVRIAVLVPCYNEAAAIGDVVADFRAALPGATI